MMQNVFVCFLRLLIVATVVPWFDSETLKELEASQDCLDFEITSIIANKTNEKREIHSADPLIVDEDLILEATEIAWQFTSKGNVYQHDRRGETVHIVPINDTDELSKEDTDFDAVESWYRQKIYYTGDYYAATRFAYEYFTQMVWKSTKKIGCGACHNAVAIYIVCKYEPQGNIRTKFQSNVDVEPSDLNGSMCAFHYGLSYSWKPVVILMFLILKF